MYYSSWFSLFLVKTLVAVLTHCLSVRMSTNLRLPWQIRPAAVHQVDAGQPIFAGDFLCSKVLLDGHGVVGPTFDCGVVGHNHALRPVDSTNAGNDSGRGNLSKLAG